jgi:hypothetical protein
MYIMEKNTATLHFPYQGAKAMIEPISAGLGQQRSPWNTRRLWSLWDMVKHPLNDLYRQLNALWTKTRDAAVACGDNSAEGQLPISPAERKELGELAEKARSLCEKFELDGAAYEADELHKFATAKPPAICPRRDTHDKLDRLLGQIQFGLDGKFFVYLTAERVKQWKSFESAGLVQNVKTAFGDDAAHDLEAAIDCYLSENDTACVFHLMRAVEHGLRALAWDRCVIFDKESPIELQDWGKIVDKLESKEKEITSYPKTVAREEQFEFYHSAMVELRAFKNLYRNPTDHARVFYDGPQALSALTHVSAFLRRLATKISATSRTPERWTKAQL